MTKYEYLMLANPGITGDETSGLEQNFEKLVKQFKGSLVSFDRWGKCRLAYPVKHRDYGVYYMVRFEMDSPQDFLKEIKLLLDVKYNDLIIRAATVKIDARKNYTDFRPESVEDIPTRNVDQFLRENKMEGLIGKDAKAPAKEAVADVKPVEATAKETVVEEVKKEASSKADSKDEGASA
ncbi:MAG: small subunit ribosomal protein S6 [Alteromonas naphthalenivorans]|jgi:small subunit ribosomal protein S6